MSDDPFGDAMDDAEETDEDSTRRDDADLSGHYEALSSGRKTHTVGVSVTEEMHRFYGELKRSDDVAVDPADSVRDDLAKLARRHEDVFERAMRKLEIDREVDDG